MQGIFENYPILRELYEEMLNNHDDEDYLRYPDTFLNELDNRDYCSTSTVIPLR